MDYYCPVPTMDIQLHVPTTKYFVEFSNYGMFNYMFQPRNICANQLPTMGYFVKFSNRGILQTQKLFYTSYLTNMLHGSTMKYLVFTQDLTEYFKLFSNHEILNYILSYGSKYCMLSSNILHQLGNILSILFQLVKVPTRPQCFQRSSMLTGSGRLQNEPQASLVLNK